MKKKEIRQQKKSLRKLRRTQKRSPFSLDKYLELELLRFTTAGSVDDGKSTLIGRLLYDSRSILKDQIQNIEKLSKQRGEDYLNLALLTDGLRAEREQGITIDVAYRYFTTMKRKYIIADTPGHEQYTRNMVTGASTANLAIVLIDARKGILTQTKRHSFIASLLGIPHLLLAINKMDMVNWSQSVFQRIVEDFMSFSEKLNIQDMQFIPISALKGDNVVLKSKKMLWYNGPSIMEYLENLTISADRDLQNFRLPIQLVIRPNQDFRAFSGRIESGTIATGDEVMVLPSEKKSSIKEIYEYDKQINSAFQGQSVSIRLEDEIDISRGDIIVRSKNLPLRSTKFEAILCWMDDSSELALDSQYLIQHCTRNITAIVRNLHYRININSLHREDASNLGLNEIGRVELETVYPLYFDPYNENRTTGSFILIDPSTNLTVAAGMIRHELREGYGSESTEETSGSNNRSLVSLDMRMKKNNHRPLVLWLTGLSGSGKTTIASALEYRLFQDNKQVSVLDGDDLRGGLSKELGFSEEDRWENIRRAAYCAYSHYKTGSIVICSFISPLQGMRDFARSLFSGGDFFEIHIKVSVDIAKERDPKGLYTRVAAGEITNFTGIHQVYEEGDSADLVIQTNVLSLEESVERIIKLLIENKYEKTE